MSGADIRGVLDEPAAEKRVGPLELFFDLVFVFALTQVTARLAYDLSAGSLLLASLAIPAAFEGDALLFAGGYLGVRADVELDLGALAAASLGVTVAAALWWTYFDETLEEIERRLQDATGRARNTSARDAFSFLHLPLVAGIVLFALGVKKTLGDIEAPLKAVAAVGLCGGCALFLAAGVAFRFRSLGTLERVVSWPRPCVCA